MITADALARLTIAWEACQLAETARTAVTVDGDPAELLARAHEVLEAAERYAATVHAFTSQQAVATSGNWLLPEAPEEAAADLDDWVLRHQDGEDLGPAPISGRLGNDVS
jgi:histidinol-phosphate/aromatic aminotransferase/cobyric acid decarboxylase-like protein